MTRILYKLNGNWTDLEVEELVVLGGQLTTLYKTDMHPNQKALLELIQGEDISKMSLREIGEKVGIKHPQQVKHHIDQLKKKNLIFDSITQEEEI